MENRNERGISLIELTIAASVMAIALFLITSNSMSSVGTLRSMARVADNAERVGNVVHSIEKHVRGGTGFVPVAWLVNDLGSSPTATVDVDTVRGFSDLGSLAIGTGSTVEYIAYEHAFDDSTNRGFQQLVRGQNDTNPRSHTTGTVVRWAATGEVVTGSPPPAGTYDGESVAPNGTVFFRGQATGFVFQRPLMIGVDREFGSVVSGTTHVDGWTALYWVPVTTLSELERNRDLNRDGDKDDEFDLGQLRKRTWSPIGTTVESEDVPISPTAIVQERDKWGVGDLDGDGLADPMFLWHDRTSKLQIQLVFWVGRDGRNQQFTRAESSIRLER